TTVGACLAFTAEENQLRCLIGSAATLRLLFAVRLRLRRAAMLGEIQTKPMEILLVEDGLMDAKITIHALRRSMVHHRLTLVRTTAEALRFLKRDGVFSRAPVPDLLLLDLCLPDGDGLEIVTEMRAFPDR